MPGWYGYPVPARIKKVVPDTTSKFYNTRQIAQACGVSVRTVRVWVVQGKIKAIRPGDGRGQWLIERAWFEAWAKDSPKELGRAVAHQESQQADSVEQSAHHAIPQDAK